MRCLPFKTGSVCLAIALLAGGPPAMAQESAVPPPHALPAEAPEEAAALPPAYHLPPEQRSTWLAECHRRMFAARPAEPPRSSRKDKKGYEAYPADGCETYLDDYYAYYAQDYARYLRQVYGSPASADTRKQTAD